MDPIKLIPIADWDGMHEAAEAMLNKALKDPTTKMAIQELLEASKNSPEALIANGFVFGAMCAISEIRAGRIRPIGEG